jgi:hypothetical protein
MSETIKQEQEETMHSPTDIVDEAKATVDLAVNSANRSSTSQGLWDKNSELQIHGYPGRDPEAVSAEVNVDQGSYSAGVVGGEKGDESRGLGYEVHVSRQGYGEHEFGPKNKDRAAEIIVGQAIKNLGPVALAEGNARIDELQNKRDMVNSKLASK